MTESDVVKALRKDIARIGGLRKWARANKVSAPYTSRVARGEKPPTEAILSPLGLECVKTYRRIG